MKILYTEKKNNPVNHSRSQSRDNNLKLFEE
jgi:hypothetical protein